MTTTGSIFYHESRKKAVSIHDGKKEN